MTPTVAVITDSAASLPADLARTWGIRVVPLQVIVDGVSFAEGADISPADVLRDLESGQTVTTSQPSPHAFEQAYRHAESAGATDVVAVLLAGSLSGTVAAARTAAQHVKIPVTVVDSETVAMATGFAAVAAAALAKTGADATAVADEARRVVRSTVCIFTVDTLEYLRKGGRINPAVAAAGKMLGVRPVLEVVGGEIVVAERVRGTTRARDALLARVDAAVEQYARPAVAVMTLGGDEFAATALEGLRDRHPSLAMALHTPISAVLSAHAGPGTIAAVVADLPAHVE
jgi:DegV family protein with EDD domain